MNCLEICPIGTVERIKTLFCYLRHAPSVNGTVEVLSVYGHIQLWQVADYQQLVNKEMSGIGFVQANDIFSSRNKRIPKQNISRIVKLGMLTHCLRQGFCRGEISGFHRSSLSCPWKWQRLNGAPIVRWMNIGSQISGRCSYGLKMLHFGKEMNVWGWLFNIKNRFK